ncbi:lipase [Leptospira ognonensis]|uniref:Lipase n=1 Tax=Leptospira ognonensis TaxID=2484945 RepID=A0A4R9JZE4_9LEPT|nr:GDSL-type esterase/lipase family protein [Leptospira ognonensis]TGL57099.1 lipase [Leptospira ognonensis]
MSRQNKNRLPFSGRSILSIFFLLTFIIQCRSLRVKDYFHPSFECHAGAGWKNAKDYQKYRTKFWLPNRLLFQEENQKLKQSKVVIAGNSLVQGFTPDLMSKEFPGLSIVNRGIGGDMTESLLDRLDTDVLMLNPQTIVIEIGGNDLIYSKCLSVTQKNIEMIVEKIHKRNSNTKIIFLATPPTLVPELNKIVPIYNLYLSEFSKNHKNVMYVEVWNDMRKSDDTRIDDEFVRSNGDPIHFNEKGYEVWGKKLRPLIQ